MSGQNPTDSNKVLHFSEHRKCNGIYIFFIFFFKRSSSSFKAALQLYHSFSSNYYDLDLYHCSRTQNNSLGSLVLFASIEIRTVVFVLLCCYFYIPHFFLFFSRLVNEVLLLHSLILSELFECVLFSYSPNEWASEWIMH